MLFVSAEDFFEQVRAIPPLTRGEEQALAARKDGGDEAARRRLIEGHLPLVAAVIRRAPPALHTLATVYACIAAMEKGVDGFDFAQDGETFAHHLSWRLRQCITRCIADRKTKNSGGYPLRCFLFYAIRTPCADNYISSHHQ